MPGHDQEEAMRTSLRAKIITATAAAVAALVVALPSSVEAASARMQCNTASGGFIIGVGGGTCNMNFQGRTYRLRISGVSAGTIGGSAQTFVGTASNMRRASDIVGTYSAGGAGLAVGGGANVAQLQNANGVVLRLQGRSAGFQASLGVAGVTITME
jgi:hypothetical protein